VLQRWLHSDNLWLRRASIVCQRRLKTGFDAHLLYETILPSIGDSPWAREFFLRKGIGWALRERSRRAPEEVRAFCREYAGQLSSLTRREALRVIDRRKA
jgi:3-methyladenine DNA glycosylase AlkD